jgi:integrase
VCQVRFGKAMKGSPPKRRSVLTVWEWVPQVLAQWIGEARPLMPSAGESAALWPSERGPRIGSGTLHKRLCEYRDALGLDEGLDFHSLRRSYVTHLIEAGWDPLFVQLLSSPREGVRDVHHEPGRCGNLRAGGGYLRSSVTQIPRRSDACAAGADARLVA